MKNRISAFVLVFALILSSLGTVYAYPGDSAFLGTDDSTSVKQESDVLCKLLVSLGVLGYDTSDFIRTEPADISDFITALAVIEYMDVSQPISTLYAQLRERGIVRDGDMPASLAAQDVIYSMVRLTGFWQYAESKGGFPGGYIIAAQSKKLLRNIALSENGVVNKGELVQFIYNALSIPSNVVTTLSQGEAIYEIGDPETLLERRFDIAMVEGVVTAGGTSGLYGKSELGTTEGEIDRVVYNTDDISMRPYLGKHVVAFVRHEDKANRDTVICLEASDLNRIVTVNEQTMGDTGDDFVEYLDGGKYRKATLASDAPVLLNGVLYGTASTINLPAILNTCSSVELIDNNGDRKFEVASVWNFEHLAVGSVTKNVVFFKYGMDFGGSKQLKLEPEDDDGYKVEAYKNGNPIESTTEISANDVVSVAMSTNTFGDKFMTVHASDKSVTSKITAIRTEGSRYIIEVGEGEFGQSQEYPVTDDFARISGMTGAAVTDPDVVRPEPGIQAVLVLTYDGYVADIRKVSSVDNYGYIIAVDTSGSILKPEARIKLIDTSGNVNIYPFAEKVVYYDAAALDGDSINGSQAAARLRARGSDYRCLCIYKLNSEGEVAELYTTYDNTGNLPGKVGYPLTLDFKATSEDMIPGSRSAYSDFYFGFLGGHRYYVEQNNILFVVPSAQDAENEELYAVVNMAFYGTNYRFPNIELYGCNRFYEGKVGVTMAQVTYIPTIATVPAIVTRIGEALDTNGDSSMMISYYQDGMSLSASIKDTALRSAGGFIDNVLITDLKPGDIALFGTSLDGKIDKFTLLFRADEQNTFGSTEGTGIECHYVKVVDIKDGVILANTSPDGEAESGIRAFRLGNPNAQRKFGAAKYTKSTKKTELSSTAELMIGDTIFLKGHYGFAIDMFIIRD